jgi:glyoxylase-like metal-dependent hydrolase (beta-lactamase superfamily II)
MLNAMNRRNFLQLGLTAVARRLLAPRWMNAQSHGSGRAQTWRQARRMRPRERRSKPPSSTTIYYLLQGTGRQHGPADRRGGQHPDRCELCSGGSADSARPLPPRARTRMPFLLINTHWHGDHTGGNEGLHAAGFTIFAHQKTRERLSTPQTMKMFHRDVPAATPAGALPTITFDDALNHLAQRRHA